MNQNKSIFKFSIDKFEEIFQDILLTQKHYSKDLERLMKENKLRMKKEKFNIDNISNGDISQTERHFLLYFSFNH